MSLTCFFTFRSRQVAEHVAVEPLGDVRPNVPEIRFDDRNLLADVVQGVEFQQPPQPRDQRPHLLFQLRVLRVQPHPAPEATKGKRILAGGLQDGGRRLAAHRVGGELPQSGRPLGIEKSAQPRDFVQVFFEPAQIVLVVRLAVAARGMVHPGQQVAMDVDDEFRRLLVEPRAEVFIRDRVLGGKLDVQDVGEDLDRLHRRKQHPLAGMDRVAADQHFRLAERHQLPIRARRVKSATRSPI